MTNNQQVATCILAKHYDDSTKRAIHSARKFDLAVYLGLTHDPVDLCTDNEIRVYPVVWNNDFADARNQLLANISHDYVLWLDSDEEIFSFPKFNWNNTTASIFYVNVQFDNTSTPNVHCRMHRNRPSICWQGRIHERITINDTQPHSSQFMNGLIIQHFGYEDKDYVLEKHLRNLDIAKHGLESGNPSYYELLERARAETAQGKSNFMHWLQCYTHAVPKDICTPSDRRMGPAIMMCMAGYTTPAKNILQDNPSILFLHIAILAAEIHHFTHIDEDRLNYIELCLQNGLYDVYYNFPRELLGAKKSTIVAYIEQWTAHWDKVMSSNTNQALDRTIKYQRLNEVDAEAFDADLLLMHQQTRKVVVLNPVAAVLWDVLQEPHTAQELLSLLCEAHRDENVATLSQSVDALLVELHNAELIKRAIE